MYAKPLQNLDIEKRVSVLEYMIAWISMTPCYKEIILGIAEGTENMIYVDVAKEKNIPYLIGSEEDVLSRVIQCGEYCQATDLTRFTTESPFTYFEAIEDAWAKHVGDGYDFTCLDGVPDGSGFELITLDSLKYSHLHGNDKHRLEFCSLYIRENKDKFKIQYVEAPPKIKRTDIRLTIDYPEDLILCRAIYSHFKEKAPKIPLVEIIEYLDENPQLKAIVDPFVAEGLKTMYI